MKNHWLSGCRQFLRWGLLAVVLMVLLPGCERGDGPRLGSEAALAVAMENLELLLFSEAQQQFLALRDSLDPEDPYWELATYGLGLSLWKTSSPGDADYDRAQSLFALLARRGVARPVPAAAQLNLARMQMLFSLDPQESRLEDAILLLRELTQSGHATVRDEAALRLAEVYRMRFTDWQSATIAKQVLQDWLNRYPRNAYAAIMWEELAYLHLYFGENWSLALDAFVASSRRGVGPLLHEGKPFWVAAQLALELGRYHDAVRLLQLLAREFPASGFAYEAIESLRRIQREVPGMQLIQIPIVAQGGSGVLR